MENYHKIVWTAITDSSHDVKATDFKTGKMLTEKLWKQNIERATFIASISYNLFPFQLTMGMISLERVFVK